MIVLYCIGMYIPSVMNIIFWRENCTINNSTFVSSFHCIFNVLDTLWYCCPGDSQLEKLLFHNEFWLSSWIQRSTKNVEFWFYWDLSFEVLNFVETESGYMLHQLNVETNWGNFSAYNCINNHWHLFLSMSEFTFSWK